MCGLGGLWWQSSPIVWTLVLNSAPIRTIPLWWWTPWTATIRNRLSSAYYLTEKKLFHQNAVSRPDPTRLRNRTFALLQREIYVCGYYRFITLSHPARRAKVAVDDSERHYFTYSSNLSQTDAPLRQPAVPCRPTRAPLSASFQFR